MYGYTVPHPTTGNTNNTGKYGDRTVWFPAWHLASNREPQARAPPVSQKNIISISSSAKRFSFLSVTHLCLRPPRVAPSILLCILLSGPRIDLGVFLILISFLFHSPSAGGCSQSNFHQSHYTRTLQPSSYSHAPLLGSCLSSRANFTLIILSKDRSRTIIAPSARVSPRPLFLCLRRRSSLGARMAA